MLLFELVVRRERHATCLSLYDSVISTGIRPAGVLDILHFGEGQQSSRSYDHDDLFSLSFSLDTPLRLHLPQSLALHQIGNTIWGSLFFLNHQTHKKKLFTSHRGWPTTF